MVATSNFSEAALLLNLPDGTTPCRISWPSCKLYANDASSSILQLLTKWVAEEYGVDHAMGSPWCS